MARDGVLPKFLSCWHSKKNIPRAGIIFHFIISMIFIFALTLNQLNVLNIAEYISWWLQRAISALILCNSTYLCLYKFKF
jgi:amino acid transporter